MARLLWPLLRELAESRRTCWRRGRSAMDRCICELTSHESNGQEIGYSDSIIRITSLFAALCIHAISIKRGVDVTRRIAEHRAQMCLLALQEIQKYWRINNNLLDLFLQYLDVSIAKRIHGTGQVEGMMPILEPQLIGESQNAGRQTTPAPDGGERYDFPTPQTQAQTKAFEDQYFNMLYGPWEGDDGVADLGLVLQANDPLQMDCLNFLGRSL